jgi:hypothetical protein
MNSNIGIELNRMEDNEDWSNTYPSPSPSPFPPPNTKYYSKIDDIYSVPLSPAFNSCPKYYKKIINYQYLMSDVKHKFYTTTLDNPYYTVNTRQNNYTHFNFLEGELIHISSVDNYYVNFISTTIFKIFSEINNILQLNYTSQEDQNNFKIFNENLNMMYNFLSEGNNVLNMDKFKNLHSIIFLIGISVLNIKYVPLIISVYDIDLEDIIIRNHGHNTICNLMMLSLINDDVRFSIIDKIGKTKYTEFLLKKEKFSVFENEGLMTYLEFSFLTDSFKNILNNINYSIISKYKFFNQNNILHLIAILFNDSTFRNEVIFNFEEIDLNILSSLIFDRNEYDLIPLEMINPNNFDKINCDKFHIFYTFNSEENIQSFYFSNLNISPKLLFNMYNILQNTLQNRLETTENKDEMNKLNKLNKLKTIELKILCHFNNGLKFYKAYDTEETQTYIRFIKSLYDKNYNQNLYSKLNIIQLIPYFSPEHMNEYIEYLKNKENKQYDLQDLLNCEFYDIHINKDIKHNYLNILLEDDNVFYNLIYEKIKLYEFNTNNTTNNEIIEMIEFIKGRISKAYPSTNDIKLMLILKNIEFNKFWINIDNVNLDEIYHFIVNEEKQKTSFNRNVMNNIIPYILDKIDLVKTNYDFVNIFLQNCNNHLLLFNSNIPIHIKFGTTQNEILNSLNYYNSAFNVQYAKGVTDEYLNINGEVIAKIFLSNIGYDYAIFDRLKQIFNIEQEFFDKMNLPKKFKDILLEHTDNNYNTFWIKSFLEAIKLNKEFFDEEFCCELLELPYLIQKIFIENKYLSRTYLNNYYYTEFLRIVIKKYDKYIESYIKTDMINYKDIFESELIIKFIEKLEDCEFILSNEDFLKSLKIGLKTYETEIKSHLYVNHNNYNSKLIYQLSINNCFLRSYYDEILQCSVINTVLKYIRSANISLTDIIDKLAVISCINYCTMRYILLFLFTNCKDEELIINYFRLIKIDSFPLKTYINIISIIENDNIFRAMFKVFENKKDVLANVIISNKKLFMKESDIINIDEKIQLLLDNYDSFENTFIYEFIDSIKKFKNINTCPEKLFELIETFKIEVDMTVLNIFPELINCSLTKVEEIDKIIELSILDETIIQKLLKFKIKSQYVFNKLKSTFIKVDFETYIMILTLYNKQHKFETQTEMEMEIDKEDIINECKKNSHLYLNLLRDGFFKDEELDSFVLLKNNTETLIISQCGEELILKYFDKISKEEILEKNIFGTPQLFSFCSTENIIRKIFDRFSSEQEEIFFKNTTDKIGRNIYYYCARFGLFEFIPDDVINYDFLLKIIINSKSDITLKKFLDRLINNTIFNKLFNEVDNENVSLIIHLAKYRPSIFKAYYGGTLVSKLVEILGNINMNNETYLMNLIKYSDDVSIMFVINKLFQSNLIKLNMTYVDNNSGSILTYLIKYSKNISKIIIKNNFIKDILYDLSYIYDTVSNIINPFSNTNSEKNVRLNLLQIAALYDVEVLRFLINNLNRKRLQYLIKEKIIFEDKEFNLLSLAICNNPEAVQEILSHNLCDDTYIQETEKLFSNFEEVSDIQPGSFYYLQSSSKTSKRIKLNMDYHYYGYNYKNKITPNNINKVTHYILDKQETGSGENLCEICMNYKKKVVLTKCSHKVCIVCALKTKNCQTCRAECDEKDKILI